MAHFFVKGGSPWNLFMVLLITWFDRYLIRERFIKKQIRLNYWVKCNDYTGYFCRTKDIYCGQKIPLSESEWLKKIFLIKSLIFLRLWYLLYLLTWISKLITIGKKFWNFFCNQHQKCLRTVKFERNQCKLKKQLKFSNFRS